MVITLFHPIEFTPDPAIWTTEKLDDIFRVMEPIETYYRSGYWTYPGETKVRHYPSGSLKLTGTLETVEAIVQCFERDKQFAGTTAEKKPGTPLFRCKPCHRKGNDEEDFSLDCSNCFRCWIDTNPNPGDVLTEHFRYDEIKCFCCFKCENCGNKDTARYFLKGKCTSCFVKENPPPQ